MLSLTNFAMVMLAVAAIATLIVASVAGLLRIMRCSLTKQIASRYRADEIVMQDLTANYFGLESRGIWQCRGNGALVLTPHRLHFFMFQPRSELQIPCNRITRVDLVRSHLGKTVFRDLLKVHFENEGAADSVAWYVAEPTRWLHQLQDLAQIETDHPPLDV